MPRNHRPQDNAGLPELAGDIMKLVAQLRWHRDVIRQRYEEGAPELDALPLDVATVVGFTPTLTQALTRISKALANTSPKPRKRTR